MAIQQVGMFAPRQEREEPREKKKTAMETLMEGLQIANGVLGIGSNIQQIRAGSAQMEANEAAAADKKAGVLTKDQEIEARSKFDPAQEGDQGSFLLGQVRGQDGKLSPLLAKTKTPLQKAISTTRIPGVMKGGKPYTVVRGSDGSEQWLEEYQKPEAKKEQELLSVETVDANGNPVTKIVPKTAGAEYAKPKKAISEDERFNKLSKPDQITVTKLTEDAARMTPIVTQIDNQLANLQKAWASGNTDLAVQQGSEMLKILNSDIGKDAVGAEEAKRLGSFLEYKIANVTGPGSFIGRDVEKFFEQAAQKNNSLKQTITANRKTADDILSGKGVAPLTETRTAIGPKGGDGTAVAAPFDGGKMTPGTRVRVGGVDYTVGADGDTLEPVGGH